MNIRWRAHRLCGLFWLCVSLWQTYPAYAQVTGLNSVPDVNVTLPQSARDVTGHGFEPTYLDKTRAAYSMVHTMITNSLDALDL